MGWNTAFDSSMTMCCVAGAISRMALTSTITAHGQRIGRTAFSVLTGSVAFMIVGGARTECDITWIPGRILRVGLAPV